MVIDEKYIEKLCNTVAKTLIEALENLSIEDINMYRLGYNMAIDNLREKFVYKAFCDGCSWCCNCYEEGRQSECEDWNAYMEIAEQLKG